MRIQPVALRAASTVTILGTALAAALLSAPAQASRSGVSAGNPARSHLSLAGAARSAALRGEAGLISGVVDGAGGRPLTGACVVATGPGGSALAVTQSDGRYNLGGLRPGGYTLHYSACGAGGHYMDQWSGGASWPNGATTVTITRGQAREIAPVTLTTTSRGLASIPRAIARLASDAGLPSGLRSAALNAKAVRATSSASQGAITGKVTGGGKPLQGICAIAYGGPSFRQARTSKTGTYRITKLGAGRYFVFFFTGYCGKNSGNWLPQYYKDVNGPNFRHPTRVRVTAGHTTTGIDAALQLGGQISGTVRSQHGKVLSRVCVIAVGKVSRFFFQNYDVSGKHGHYVLHSLFPGKYQVAFVPSCGNTGNYVPQWWRDSLTRKHATTIAIKHGSIVTHVDGALQAGAIISGVVTAQRPRGALLKGICVSAQPVSNQGFFPTYANARTRSDGSYRLTGLLGGKYRVFFNRGCGNNGNFLPVRRTVSVVLGHTTSGFDAVMPPGAIITGTVTNTQGAPVRGVCVQASGRSFGGRTTNAEGQYSIIALQTGNYTLSFSGGCGNSGSYAPQFYRGQVNDGSATPVAATAGDTTSGIDATMQPGGTISGVVTNPSGQRLGRVCVIIDSLSVARYGYPFNLAETNKHGTFTARNLVPGLYSVNFNCLFFFGQSNNRKFASQWFMGQSGQGTANEVSAPAGVITSGINAVLRPGGFITGTVTNSAGKPVSGMCVEATPHGSPIAEPSFFNQQFLGFTNSHGVYRIGRLSAATYDVQVGCFGGDRYASQWVGGGASRSSATPVTVTDGGTAAGADAVLTIGGSISGEVTAANHPEPNVCVEADNAANNTFGFGYTNRHGRYSMNGLSSGSYEVTFIDCGFFRHHVTLGTATTTVTVVAPQAATGVNENLVPAGSISGTVLGGPGATPQDNVCVAVVPVGQNTTYDYTATNRHGAYRLNFLGPGTYNVFFGDPFCAFTGTGYAPQWYNNKASQATADKVTVTSGGDTSKVDAMLGADGAISGTVTSRNQDGGVSSQHRTPVVGECVTATPTDQVADPVSSAVLHPVIGVTAADGTYSLVGLLPGKYTVEFSVGCGDTGFQTQWWHHSGTAGGATVITVSANATVTGIDASLRHHGDGG